MAKKWSQTARRQKGIVMRARSRAIAPSDKARFHVVEGAGKGHVIRDFLGFDESDVEAIVARIRQHWRQAGEVSAIRRF